MVQNWDAVLLLLCCALVNKEVPPYAVVAGVPAKIIASVFTKEQIVEHEKALYSIERRLTIKEIDDLFEKYFKDKRAIGQSKVNDVDFKKIIAHKKMQFDIPIKQ